VRKLRSILSDTSVSNDEEMMYYFLTKQVLPKGFIYPESFIKYIKYDTEVKELEPYILFRSKDRTQTFNRVVKEQYPSRTLVPFGKDNNSDDVFCFDGTDISGNPKVYIVHTYASPGWEDKGYVEDFTAWLTFAQEAHDAYEKQREEEENYGS
jgi:hypothetical protein